MKKTYRLAVIAAIFAGFVLSSCSNGLVDYGSYSPTITPSDTESEKAITFIATTEDGLITFSETDESSSRTVLPSQLNGDTGLDFFLGYKKKGETSFTFNKQWETGLVPGQISFTADTTKDATKCTGSVTATFDLASYQFKLYAVKKDSITTASAESSLKSSAVLVGYAAADLRYNDQVTFYLSSNGLTGKGTVDITITSDWVVPTDYTATVQLNDFSTDVLKYPASGAAAVPKDSDNKLSLSNWSGGSDPDIASGSYNIVVTLTNTKTSKSYIYAEKLIVLPNRKSTGTVPVPNIIDYAPTQPADFIVGYTNPTATDVDYYEVEMAWTDTAYNEKGFKIELLPVDYKDATDASSHKCYKTPTKNDEWEAIQTELGVTAISLKKDTLSTSKFAINDGTTTGKDSSDGTVNDSGSSLNMNNNHVNLYLPLGHRYFARICAYNDDYDTDWTYANLHDADLKTVGCSKGDTITVGDNTFTTKVDTTAYTLTRGTTKFDADVTTINRYRITYYLNGGVFTDTATTTPLSAEKMPALTVYESQHNIDASTATVNADKVVILKPTSRAAYESKNSVSPALTTSTQSQSAVEGDANTYYDTEGNQQTGIKLQLAQSVKNNRTTETILNYWSKWVKDSIISSSTSDYSTVTTSGSTTTYTIPNYQDYDNLRLFAYYVETPQTVEITSTVAIQDITAYELKESYIVTDLLKSGSSVALDVVKENDSTVTAVPTGGFTYYNLPKTVEITNGAADEISLTIKDSSLSDEKTSSSTFTYKAVRLVVTKVGGNGNSVIIDDDFDRETTGDSCWKKSFSLKNLDNASYVLTVTAQTDEAPLITYSQNQVFKLTEY